jgi:hypothetical protein
MLYPFRYLNDHPIYGLHDNIVYFFEQLFLLDLPFFNEEKHLKNDFIEIAKQSPKRFIKAFEQIVIIYHSLPDDEKAILAKAFEANNAIEELCLGNSTAYKYDQIPHAIKENIKSFFDDLWIGYPQNSLVEEKFGNVKDHFDKLIDRTHQRAIICPFCGLNPLKPSRALRRDDYDHFLSKGFYPFNSFNFRNLFPMCDECNTDEKHDTDTLFKSNGNRRKIIYPYSTEPAITITVSIVPQQEYDLDDLETYLSSLENWTISHTHNGQFTEYLESWDAVFNVSRRYKERIKQFEREWWNWLIRHYKTQKKRGVVGFEDFKTDWIEDNFDDLMGKPMAIIEKAYFEFLFSIPDCERLLDRTIGIAA